ncbi:SHOCT domain-containing protein [Nocardia sp. NPDC049149]|uniref:SHOCT domain-containing protein n=1 Tax=Nocardia sp. NPDC049149 TaxID=3364315 RepID=UPI0037130520
MSISMIVFWGLVIAGAVAVFRYAGRPQQFDNHPTVRLTPEQLLAERFARGEIDQQEYRDRMRTLGNPTGPSQPVLDKNGPAVTPSHQP